MCHRETLGEKCRMNIEASQTDDFLELLTALASAVDPPPGTHLVVELLSLFLSSSSSTPTFLPLGLAGAVLASVKPPQ